jgi:hypothetical protein
MENNENLFMGIQEKPSVEAAPRIKQTDIPDGTIKARHIEAGGAFVMRGLAADRPTTGDTFPFYWATDTFVMSAWTGTAWKSSTFS